jgi:hypothetical protein
MPLIRSRETGMNKTDDLVHALKLLNEAFAKGAISEAEYEAHDARLRARQQAIKVWREGTAPSPRKPFLAPPRRSQRPDLPTRLLRRRGHAFGGMLPPALAKVFTVGQAAVLAVIAFEVLHQGACRKSYAELADEAGCSRRWVKATIRQARTAGLLEIEHRPYPGRWKDDTNVVRIVSVDWLAWIKTRRERQERARAAPGGTRVPPSSNGFQKRWGLEAERPLSCLSSAALMEGRRSFRLT